MTTLPEPVRRALKARLRAIGALPPGSATPKATLLALAEQHGIDIASLPTTPLSAGAAALADDDELDALDAAEAEAEANPEEDKLADDMRSRGFDIPSRPAIDSVADIIAKLGSGTWDGPNGFRTALEKLHAEAMKPAVITTVEKVVHVEKIIDRVVNPVSCKGHVPIVIRIELANQLLGTSDARGSLPVYDAPDAPALDLDYVWPAGTGMALAQLARGRNVFLSGPRGVGKTSWAEQLAARQHRPFVRVQCHEQTDAATLVGMTVPDGSTGGTRWQDGILAAAIRRPGTLILIDEPSIARPGALFAFQSVLDGSRALVSEETGERIPVADGVQFILADNTRGHGDESGLYAGTRPINSATLDRCGIMLIFGWLPADKEAKAISARAKCPLALAEALVAFAKLTRDTAEAGRLTAGLGPRRLIAWAENIMDGYANEAAFDACIHDMAAQEDRETLRQLWKANISITNLKSLARA